MISLLLLPLLLLPSVQGQTCDMAGLEERLARMEERMEERVEDMKDSMEEKMRKKEENMEAKLVAVEAKLEEKEAVLRKEVKEKMEEKEAVLRQEVKEKMEEKELVLRKELASKEEMGSAVTQGLRDLPYLTLCAYQNAWTSASSTITYDSFLTDFNNGDRPGGADGQLDLGTGVFNCLRDGIYRIDFSGYASLDPAERVQVYLYHNGVQVTESYWPVTTYPGTIGGQMYVPGSRSLMLPLQLGDTLELRTNDCTGDLSHLVLCIELADQGLSIPRP